MASESGERVVVIQDGSRSVNSITIRGILEGLSLKPGDSLKFLVVLHQLNIPSSFSLKPPPKYMSYKIKMDSRSVFGTNQKIIEEEISRKKEEYQNIMDLDIISRLCEAENIEFDVEVRPGSSLKNVAVKVAKKFKATWVILDRHIKDRSYFLQNLSCKISRMKRDNSMEQIRGQKAIASNKLLVVKKFNNDDQVSYDEMIPGSPVEEHSSKTLSIEAPSSSCTETNEGEDEDTSSIFLNKENTRNPYSNNHLHGSQKQMSNNKNGRSWLATSSNEVFDNSICSVCNNRRPKFRWKRDFTYAELQAATDGFSPKKYLSEGGFGSVFRGEINGLTIAVKQHKIASDQGEKEFKSEVQVLSKARHENLVMLLGSCSEGNHRLLVYEYVCNGSLDQHLSSRHRRKSLSWEKRMKIALGAAKGLQYLHENNIIHRDMRPNNILVTHDFEPLLGDFGLAKTRREDMDYSSETGVVGTLGYLAPEYAECGKLSTKTDVYSFGVVLLQLITGLSTTDKKLGEKSLVGWARPLLKERNYPDLIDPSILECHDVHQLFCMVQVAEKCLSKDPRKRLPMETVLEALKYTMEGNANSNIRCFSLALSDYASSSYCDSSESPSVSPSQSEEDPSFSVATTSASSKNVRFAPAATALPVQTFRRLPPSPPPSSSAERSTISTASVVARRSTTSTNRRGKVLYDEMII